MGQQDAQFKIVLIICLRYCSKSDDPNLLSNISFSYHVLVGKKINRLYFHGQHLQETDLRALE